MAETKNATGDSESARRRSSPGARLLAVAALVAGAIGLVIWIRSVTWQRAGQLETEFAAIRSERFLLGLHARESIVRMDAALLRYQLSGDVGEQAAFLRIGRELIARMQRTIPELVTEPERTAAAAFAQAYEGYRKATADMIERAARPIRKDTASQVQDVILEKSRDIVRRSEELVEAQNRAWEKFIGGSTLAMASLRQMLWVSVIALLVFTVVLAVLAYGTFVAPLRAMLTQSKMIIERHEKLASLGTLAAGVAHEIRNPLQAIKMRLFSLNKTLPREMKENEDLGVISSEINRLEKIVRQTLEFARPGEPDMTVVDASQLVAAVAELLAGTLAKRGVQLQAEPGAKLMVRVDRQQIQQVLINLVLNGAESIRDTGVVTIRSRSDSASIHRRMCPVVRLEVSDTGTGIPEEAEARIFDPFFSTKEGGTGLGLSIAARIVEKHGGFIHYTTRQGRGTTFAIVLPLAIE